MLAALLATSCLVAGSAHAQDATWVGGNAGDPDEWVENNNWTPTTVPTGTATFGNTGVTTVANDAGIVVINTVSFTGSAQSYTFSVDNPFIVNGTGILNANGTQTFNVNDTLIFQNSSTITGVAGSVALSNNGFIYFQNSSNSGDAAITNNDILQYFDNSQAASATIVNNVEMDFFDNSFAGTANITNSASGTITFNINSSASQATIVNNSGTIQFNNSANGGISTITNNGTGTITFNNSATAATANINSAGTASVTFNNNASAGGATIEGGILAFNNFATAGTSNIVNTVSLNFNNSSTAGNASIGNTSTGTLNFNDTSTAGNAVMSNTAGLVNFNNSSSAANADIFSNDFGGTITFHDTSTAGNATIASTANVDFVDSSTGGTANVTTNSGGTTNFDNTSNAQNASLVVNSGGVLNFNDTATAGSANVLNFSGTVAFNASSLAGSATMLNDGTMTFSGLSDAQTASISNDAALTFSGNSTADSAVIITNTGGLTEFTGGSGGGTAQLIMNGGTVDISLLTSTGTTAGSIAGTSGSILLGSKNLSVGGNNFSSSYGGSIADGGAGGGINGSLTKVGTGTLTLTGASTYTGGTTVSQGVLQLGDGTTNGTIAGNVLVDNGATLAFDAAGTATFGGSISGAGGVAVIGGTVVLTNSNSYSGFTDVLGGTLRAGGANVFSSSSDVVISSGATLDLNGNNNVIASLSGAGFVTLGNGATLTTVGPAVTTYSGVISGTNSTLTMFGTGILTLSGANTFSGFMTVLTGTIQAGAADAFSPNAAVVVAGGATLDLNSFNQTIASITGAGNVTLGSATLTTNGDNTSGTLSGVISGTGGLTKVGTGTLTLSGLNTYTGATTVSGGTLQMGIAGALSSATDVTVASGATFDLNSFNQTIGSLSGAGNVTLGAATLTEGDSTTTLFSGVISGSGGLTKVGTGTQTLSGANTYSGATNVNAGTLQAGATNAFSAASDFTIASGAALNVNNFNQTIGSLSGAGNVTLGTATLTTNGDNANTTFSGVISGSGGLTKVGTGTLILSGANTYSGATNINAGSLQAGATGAFSAASDFTVASGATLALANFNETLGSLSGSGNVTLGTGTLSTNADNATTTFAGDISGTGGLTKIGTGTLFLTGSSTYSGQTLVIAGILDVNGSIANSTVTVGPNATLKGNGTVGGLIAGNGAIIAPGNSIGTIHVAGNVSFGPGSTYQDQINAAGQSDLIAAGGAAALNGGTVVVQMLPGTYAASTTYTILTATGGVSGTFAGVTTGSAVFIPTLTYTPTAVDLTINLINLASFAQTKNQIAVANAIQANMSSALFNAIVPLTPAQMRTAFDMSSGEIHASIRSALLEDGQTLRLAVLDRLEDADGPAVWGRLFGTWGSIDSDGNAATLRTNFSGFTVGADTPVAHSLRVGVLGGYGQVQGFVGARNSSLNADTAHFGVYGDWAGGPFSLKAGVIGSWGTARSDRNVIFPGFTDTDTAKQSIRTTQAFGELGYRVDYGTASLEPFANAGWIEANTGSFAEAGGIAALSGGSSSSNQTFTTLGLRFTGTISTFDDNTILPTASLGWMHSYAGLTPARTLTFEATGASFTVLGVPLDRDQAVIDAGFIIHPVPEATVNFGYEGLLSDRVSDNGLHASVAWSF